jgi:hypothetical protein
MSNPRNVPEQVKEELKTLYTQLGDLNKQNNIIVKKAMRLFQPIQDNSEFKKELGDLPERIKKVKEEIRTIENQHHLETKLDSPSAPAKYRK